MGRGGREILDKILEEERGGKDDTSKNDVGVVDSAYFQGRRRRKIEKEIIREGTMPKQKPGDNVPSQEKLSFH